MQDNQEFWINPNGKQLHEIRRLMELRGTCRGFWIAEQDMLIVFDSYGNTHDSMARKLLTKDEWYDAIDLIFRPDFSVWASIGFHSRAKKLEWLFSEKACAAIRGIYRNERIRLVNCD